MRSRAVLFFALLFLAMAGFFGVSSSVSAERLGFLVSEPDGSPSKAYVHSVTLPNGSASVDAGILTLNISEAAASINTETLSGNITLGATDERSKAIQNLDPNGANRNVTLPAEASASGRWYQVKNTATIGTAFDLLVKDDAAATIATVSPGSTVLVWCDGTTWNIWQGLPFNADGTWASDMVLTTGNVFYGVGNLAVSTSLASLAEPPQTTASQAEAEAGTEAALRSFSPLRIKQAIDALSGAAAGAAEVYGSGWNADTTMPEKNDIYDYLHSFDADDDGSLADETWFTGPLAAKQDVLVYSETVGGGAGALDAVDGDDITVNDIAFVSKSVQVDSGTTDGTTASKLVDAGQDFLTTVTVGDVVANTTDGTYAAVTAIDDDGTLSLSADIMTTGEAYTISSWWTLQYQVTLSNKAESDPDVVAPDTNRNNKTWERQNWWKNGVFQFNTFKIPSDTASPPTACTEGQVYRESNTDISHMCTATGNPGTWKPFQGQLQKIAVLNFSGGGTDITDNTKSDSYIPIAATVAGWTISATDAAGCDAVVDIWNDAYANFPPTVADQIAAAAHPTLSGVLFNKDTTLTGWDTSIAADSWIRGNYDSGTCTGTVTVTLFGVM